MTDTIVKILLDVYRFKVDPKVRKIKFVFRYKYTYAVAKTKLISHKYISKDELELQFGTSFGIFHQRKIGYNEVLVVLYKNCTGYLADLRKDCILDAYFYPNEPDYTTYNYALEGAHK